MVAASIRVEAGMLPAVAGMRDAESMEGKTGTGSDCVVGSKIAKVSVSFPQINIKS